MKKCKCGAVPCRTSRLLAIRQVRHVGRFSVNIKEGE